MTKKKKLTDKEVLATAPLRTKIGWWLMARLNICTADSFIGFILQTDRAWKAQNSFNQMVGAKLGVNKPNIKTKELKDEGGMFR